MNTHLSTVTAALAVAMAAAGAMLACSSDDPTGPQQSVTYVAQLGGNNEVPAIPGAASGTATFTLNGSALSYRVTVSGLSGNAAASHIHVGGAGVNGNIIVPFSAAQVRTGEVASGIIDLTLPISNGQTTITGDSLRFLLDRGLAYTNVHTGDHPAGEMGGGGRNGGGGSKGGGASNGGGGVY
jgi:hypothetical protein